MAWPLGAGRLTGIAPTTIQADVRRRRPPAPRRPQRFGDSRLDESVLAVWQAVTGSIPVSRTRVDRQGGTEARRPAKRLGRRVGVADYANGEPALVAMILRAITVNEHEGGFRDERDCRPGGNTLTNSGVFPARPDRHWKRLLLQRKHIHKRFCGQARRRCPPFVLWRFSRLVDEGGGNKAEVTGFADGQEEPWRLVHV
jgi:hypothetical protein